MSEKGSQKASRRLEVLIIVIVVLLIVLGGFGFVWARNLSDKMNSSPPENVESPAPIPEQNSVLSLKVKPTVSQATAAAPMSPTAVATSEVKPTVMSLPRFINPVDEKLVEEAAVWNAEFLLINDTNTGIWQYEANSFIRPIALEAGPDMAYLLDAGRVLAINLDTPDPPVLLLSPGDEVNGVRVLEPLDLTLFKDQIFVLDRAGDVYRYDLNNGGWELDRYDRPVDASSGHYFVALDMPENYDEEDLLKPPRTLLETNYKFTMQYGAELDSLWNLPEGRSVDVSSQGRNTYVLQKEMFDPEGIVTKYNDTRLIKEFAPRIAIEDPRQIVALDSAVYVLDRNGRRLMALDPVDGGLKRLYQMPQQEPISVFAVDPNGRILLAGQERLFLVAQPDRVATIPGGPVLDGIQPHDPAFLESLTNFAVPIGGSNITFRDFQLPGAPRHYRLGVHEGLDFYWQPGTKVLAANDGVVIRADLDYVPPTASQLGAWWSESQKRGYTSPETLDDYLGQQVWIEHANGLVSRYAHLRSIAPGIKEGEKVSRSQIIGEVGNSGSPASLESEAADAHLHFELWLRDTFLGQFMRPVETREWVERIFTNGD